MKKRKTSIAFIAPNILSEYHERQISFMKKSEQWSDYHFTIITPFILFLSNNRKKEASYSLFRTLKKSGFDGYIISMNTILDVYGLNFCNRLLADLEGEHVVSLSYNDGKSCSVLIDNRDGITELMNHFCQEHQYTKIGFLQGSPWQTEAMERFESYLEYLEKSGLPINQDWIMQGSFQGTRAQRLVADLIESGKPLPEAFIAVNDNSALGVMAALEENGLLDKIAVGGFDDIESAAKVGLTTVCQPMEEQLESAVKILSDMISGKPFEQKKILKPSLVVRSSCGCPSHNSDVLTASDAFRREEHLGGFNLAFINEFSTSISELRNLEDLREAILKLFRSTQISAASIFLFEDGIPRLSSQFPELEESLIEGDILFIDFPEQEGFQKKPGAQCFKEYLSEINRGARPSFRIISNLQLQDEYYGHISIQMDGMDSLLMAMVTHEIEIALHNLYLQNRLNRTMMELKSSLDENRGLLNLLAHDIKNPLCHIFYSLDIIKRRIDDRSVDGLFRIAEESVSVCSDIIDDVLSLQKYKNGDAEIIRSGINLDSFLDEQIPEHEKSAARKNIRLTVRRNLQQKEFYSNIGMLKSILRNLLSNAIKFSPENEEVSLLVSSDAGKLHIIVTDNGPGFSDKDKTRLYQPFVRLSANPIGTEKSTGLGLSLVKTLVDNLSGDISLKSNKGEGSEFSVIIPE